MKNQPPDNILDAVSDISLSCAVRPNKASLSLVQIVLMSVGLFLVFKFGIAVLLIMRWLRKDNEVEINLRKGLYP